MLPKENRITKQKEFDTFFGKTFKENRGTNVSGRFLILKLFENKSKQTRVGFLVNNKVDKRATARNLIKRRLRQAVRLNLANIKGNNDILFIAKPNIKTEEYNVIKDEVTKLFQRARVI